MATNSIFNPKDNTTKEKFSSFEYVNACYTRDKDSLNKQDDVLGEKEEILHAYTISKNSLKNAHQSFTDAELKQAFSEGVITEEQIVVFKQSKNMLEMEDKRENNLSHQSSHQKSL